MKPIIWNEEKLRQFKSLFPYRTNSEIARLFNISESSAKKKARELGLKKATCRVDAQLAAIVRDHFNLYSFSELAKLTGKPKSTIVRVANLIGLKRDEATNTAIRSRKRRELLRTEKLRVRLGFPPRTRLKVSSEY